MTGQGIWEAAHRQAYARTAWRRVLPAAGTLTYRALDRDPEDPQQQEADRADPGGARQWAREVALPAGLLVALAIWQTARTAGALVDDVALADALWVLRTEELLFARPLPDVPDGTWAQVREGGFDTLARADGVLVRHIVADARRFTPEPGRPAPLRVGDAVRSVRSGPYREGGAPRWEPAVEHARTAVTRATAVLYGASRPPGELEFARARAGRLWLPLQDEVDAAAALHPTLTAEPDTPAVPGAGGTAWIQRLVRLAHVDATATAVVQHHLDRSSPAMRPGRPLADALGATGTALADLAPPPATSNAPGPTPPRLSAPRYGSAATSRRPAPSHRGAGADAVGPHRAGRRAAPRHRPPRCPLMDTPGNGGPDDTPVLVPVRVCAVLTDPDSRVCVIRRHRPGGAQHSLPGSLAAPGEQPVDALRRELAEELGLGLVAAGAEDVEEFGLVLRFEQHQATTRPGRDGLFRRRHLICATHLPQPLAASVALVELDATDTTEVLWLAVAELAGGHLYPDLGGHLAAAVTASDGPAAAGPVLLAPMTDATFHRR
ncbi:NUDIX domain-containing protein [Kitasatospora cineracea]|uniref:NUDIX hydrolase n=1 Tax=Kitasatospora cineracea TaxID=88074 RepID=UPI0036D8C512